MSTENIRQQEKPVEASDAATMEAAQILMTWGMKHGNVPAARAVLNAFIASNFPVRTLEAIGLQWEEDQPSYPFDGPEVVKVWSGHAIGQRWGSIIECTDGLFTLLDSPDLGRYPSFEAASDVAQKNFAGKIAAAGRLTAAGPTHWHNDAGQVMDIETKSAQDEKVRLRFSEPLYSLAPYASAALTVDEETRSLELARSRFILEVRDGIGSGFAEAISERLVQRLAAALPDGRKPVGQQTAYSALLAFAHDPEIIEDDVVGLFDRAISFGKPAQIPAVDEEAP